MQSLPPLSDILEDVRAGRQAELHTSIRPFDIALLILIGLVFWWRISNLEYNTLFIDEATYARVGQAILVGQDPSNALGFMFGSFFYPTLSAMASDVGGVVAMRAVSAILTLIAALYVFLTARRLFGQTAAFWALFLFALSGPGISLGQQAVYDVLAVTFLAASMYYIIVAAQRRRGEEKYYVVAGICFGLAILAKYISITYLPALVAFALAVRLRHRGRPALFSRPAWILAFCAILIILSPYLFYNLPQIQQTFTGQFSTQTAPRMEIILTMLFDIGLVMGMAIIGLWICISEIAQMVKLRGFGAVVFWILAIALGFSLFALPIYHVASSNVRALWKHEVFALVFLAPIASVVAARLLNTFWKGSGRYSFEKRVLSAVLLIVGCLWFVRAAFVMNSNFQNSWPSFARTTQHIERVLRLQPDDFVLASGASIYEYYLFPDQPDPNRWQDSWGFEYNGVWGEPAILDAVRRCTLDAVILDDYYTPELSTMLLPELEAAGYRIEFEDVQVLYTGLPNRIRIFVPGSEGICGTRPGV